MSSWLDNDKVGCTICCAVCIGLGFLISHFTDSGSCHSSSLFTDKKFVKNLTDYHESNFGDVCDLLRERNQAELQLRLDYDRRIARCFEKHFDDSFSLEDSPYSSFPRKAGDRFLAIAIRTDLDRVKKQLEQESLHPLRSIWLIDGGALHISDDDKLHSD